MSTWPEKAKEAMDLKAWGDLPSRAAVPLLAAAPLLALEYAREKHSNLTRDGIL